MNDSKGGIYDLGSVIIDLSEAPGVTFADPSIKPVNFATPEGQAFYRRRLRDSLTLVIGGKAGPLLPK